MKNIFTYLLLALLLAPVIAFAQPAIEWRHCYGGTMDEAPNRLFTTSDSCYIVVGNTASNDGQVVGYHGVDKLDAFVLKLDRDGKIKWAKCIGGSKDDRLLSGSETSDGGCIITGITASTDGDMSERINNDDSIAFFIAKLDSSGNLSWLRTYGKMYDQRFITAIQSQDGGFLVTGDTGTYVSTENKSPVFKINSIGEVQWTVVLDSMKWISGSIKTFLEDYIIFGRMSVTEGNNIRQYARVVRLTSSGEIIWQNSYGSGGLGSIAESRVSELGEYTMSGTVGSSEGNVENYHSDNDYWVIRIDGAGRLLWSKAYGGSYYDVMATISELPDHNLIGIGHINSTDGDVSNHMGGKFDYTPWVIKLDRSGNLLWEHNYFAPPDAQGNGGNYAYGVVPAFGGGYVFAAEAHANGGDVTGHHGTNNADIWVVKLSAEKLDVNLSENANSSLQISPNPSSGKGKINYSLEHNGNVTIAIYNILGERIKTLTNELQSSGEHELRFDESSLCDGSYFIEVRSDGHSQTVPLRIIH